MLTGMDLEDFSSLPARPARTWHYAAGGGKVGPVDQATLEAKIASREVAEVTLVWTPGMQQWARADHVVELQGLFGVLRAAGASSGVPGVVTATRAMHASPPTHAMPQPAAGAPADPALQYVMPVGRSGFAIVAGYLGLFAVLLVPAPFAVVFGVLALREIRRRPELLGKGRAWFGIVMGLLMTRAGGAIMIGSMTSR
jgi:hypothetical protein